MAVLKIGHKSAVLSTERLDAQGHGSGDRFLPSELRGLSLWVRQVRESLAESRRRIKPAVKHTCEAGGLGIRDVDALGQRL